MFEDDFACAWLPPFISSGKSVNLPLSWSRFFRRKPLAAWRAGGFEARKQYPDTAGFWWCLKTLHVNLPINLYKRHLTSLQKSSIQCTTKHGMNIFFLPTGTRFPQISDALLTYTLKNRNFADCFSLCKKVEGIWICYPPRRVKFAPTKNPPRGSRVPFLIACSKILAICKGEFLPKQHFPMVIFRWKRCARMSRCWVC